jgi:hypothetical protein
LYGEKIFALKLDTNLNKNLIREAEGLISPFVKNSLDLSVQTETGEAMPCQEATGSTGGNSLKFSFTIPSDGQYLVRATLYKQNIVGSPLVIPVSCSPATELAQLGLSALGENISQVAAAPIGFNSVTGSAQLGRISGVKDSQAQPVSLPLQTNVASLPNGSEALPVGMTAKTSYQGEDLEKNKFVMGAVCFAKWDQDGVWYNAKIDKDCRERGVEVTFVDYDNSNFVQRGNIVWRKEDIPEGADVDLGPEVFEVGDYVVAQWEEDDVWYNARVVGQEEGGYSVLFTDYENVAFVVASQIFKEVAGIPNCEVLDVHLQVLLEDEQLKVEDIFDGKKMVSNWSVGNDCLARWVADGRWYNAIVDTVFESSPPVQYLVTFTDYGNSEIVTEDDLAASVDNIPGDELDMLDENVERPTLVTEHVTRNPLVRTNLDLPAIPVPMCDRLVKGSKIIAKREEDQTWHRAVIHEVTAPGRLYIVRYDDNGQFGGATPENIVMGREDIPPGEEIRQYVTEEMKNEIEERTG